MYICIYVYTSAHPCITCTSKHDSSPVASNPMVSKGLARFFDGFFDGFYSTLGVAVLGTAMDGDCGIDVACQMLSLPQTPAQRAGLREETAELLHFGNYLGFVLKGRAKS